MIVLNELFHKIFSKELRSVEFADMEEFSIFMLENGNMFEIDFSIFMGSSEGFTEQNISILQLIFGSFILSNFE